MSLFKISLNGEELEVEDKFIYVGVKVSNDCNGKVKIENKILQGRKIGDVLKALVNR